MIFGVRWHFIDHFIIIRMVELDLTCTTPGGVNSCKSYGNSVMQKQCKTLLIRHKTQPKERNVLCVLQVMMLCSENWMKRVREHVLILCCWLNAKIWKIVFKDANTWGCKPTCTSDWCRLVKAWSKVNKTRKSAIGPSKSFYFTLVGRILQRILQIIRCLEVVFCSLVCVKHLGIHVI